MTVPTWVPLATAAVLLRITHDAALRDVAAGWLRVESLFGRAMVSRRELDRYRERLQRRAWSMRSHPLWSRAA